MKSRAHQRNFKWSVAIQLVLGAVCLALLLAMLQIQHHSISYISGHHRWDEGQRRALDALELYVMSGDQVWLDRAENELDLPVSLDRARALFDDPAANKDEVARLLRQGRVPSDQIQMMLWLYPHTRDLPYMSDAMQAWTDISPYLAQIKSLRRELVVRSRAQQPLGEAERIAYTARIVEIRDGITPSASKFREHVEDGILVLKRLIQGAALLIFLVAAVVFLRLMRSLHQLLGSSERWAKAAFDQASIGMLKLDGDGRIIDANAAVGRLLGGAETYLRGRYIHEFLLPESLSAWRHALTAEAGGDGELLIRDNNGRERVASYKLSTVSTDDDRGQHRENLLLLEDISEAHALRQELDFRARHDGLTGLVNRGEIERQLAVMLQQQAAPPRQPLSVCMLDIDRFRYINDSAGLHVADSLLRSVAHGLHDMIAAPAVVGRMGGDQFLILLPGTEAGAAMTLAGQMGECVDAAGRALGDEKLLVTCSIGVLAVDPACQSPDEVLAAADQVCEEAKQAGRNRVRLLVQESNALEQRRSLAELAAAVSRAIEHDGFRLYAQRMDACMSGMQGEETPLQFEILLRMADADGNVLLPGQFLAAADLYGLSEQIDRKVLAMVLAELDRCINSCTLRGRIRCFINVMPSSMAKHEFAMQVGALLATYPHLAESICIEITESGAMGNIEQATHFINVLRKQGCSVALDDFGVGHSSFGHLKVLPCDIVKIDGGFTRDLEHDATSAVLIRSITEMSHVLGKQVVVEWVENESMAERVSALGVDFMQGFGIHRPEPLGDFLAREMGRR
ncbi:MAG: EAL domain-containing protein [Pseudomonadota bacterium]|nr:EAL domain-containing protein [Pseudomonadota bacterium]